ncbi:MAG: hypothetical protein AB7J13_13510 [Pyrinomonadaceae bacterium]
MPIKDPTIYPPYWKQFSEYIRFERAKGVCEKCGAVNGLFGKKGSDGRWRSSHEIHMLNSDVGLELYGPRFNFIGTRVVLTVAHLDYEGGVCDCRDRTGFKCARPDHVLALCQACHLAMDLPKHIENRRQTMIDRNDARRLLLVPKE